MLLRLFRTLMPHDEDFVQRLSEHGRQVAAGAASFRGLLAGEQPGADCYAALCRSEEAADEITYGVVRAIHRSFVTPFDRIQILDLVTALDDTLDLMKETGRRLRLYGIAYTAEMRAMADCAVRAAGAIAEALPLLAAVPRNAPALEAIQARVRAAEREADEWLARGLHALFAGPAPAGDKLIVEKVYDLIESVVDRCEDVADVIEGIVVELV